MNKIAHCWQSSKYNYVKWIRVSVKYRTLEEIVKNQLISIGIIVLMIIFVGRNDQIQNLENKIKGGYYFFV